MITLLSFDYDLDDANTGYVIGDHPIVNGGDKIPLYIPKLMSKIPHGKEKETNIVSIDSAAYIYKNASSCLPTNKTKIKSLNYLWGIAENNYEFKDGLMNGQKVHVYYNNDSIRQIYFNLTIK